MNKDKKRIPQLRFPEFKNEEEWEEKKLGEIANFINGKAYKQEELLTTGKYRVLRVGNFFTNNEWYYSDLELEEDKYCENGDLLYAWSASFGPHLWNEEKVIYHYHIWKVKNKHGVNKHYLYNLLDYETSRMKARSLNGFALMHITKGTIEAWESIIPKSEKEQQKIAKCISSLDEVITAHSQKLELLKEYKKGLMQNLFPQKGEKTPKVRFKEFKDEWEEVPFSSYILVIDGDRGVNYPKIEEYSSKGYCVFLNAKNVTKNGFAFNEIQFITKEKDKILRKGKLSRNDIVLTTRGSLGQFAFYDESIPFENIRINSGMVILRSRNKEILPNYLYNFCKSDVIQSTIQSQGFGNAVQQLTVNVINNFILYYPKNIKEQQKIASCLSALDELVIAQGEKIEQLKQHKKGLMQGLFPKMND